MQDEPDQTKPDTRRPVTHPARRHPLRRPVWPIVLAYWLCQPLVLGLVFLLWIGAVGDDDQMYFAALQDGEVIAAVTEPMYWAYVLFFSAIITAAQACYLWPTRKPRITTGRGRSIKTSLIVAGLMVGLGGLALILGIGGLIDREFEALGNTLDNLPVVGHLAIWAVLILVAWVLPTLLLFRFCDSGQKETVLGRLANRVLLGTAAEAVLLIPVDAMIRRRSDCYCAEGSFLGLTLLGMIGFVGAGPAVLLPMFAKRRQGWYRTHCGGCGYDMAGDPERCPECGLAWGRGRPGREGQDSPEPQTSPHPE